MHSDSWRLAGVKRWRLPKTTGPLQVTDLCIFTVCSPKTLSDHHHAGRQLKGLDSRFLETITFGFHITHTAVLLPGCDVAARSANTPFRAPAKEKKVDLRGVGLPRELQVANNSTPQVWTFGNTLWSAESNVAIAINFPSQCSPWEI